MKKLLLIPMFLYLAACNESGGGSSSPAANVSTPNLIAPVDPAQPTDPSQPTETISLTYYKYADTFAPVNGWSSKTVTTTGMCVVYLTTTYCWDDGIQTIPSWVFNNFTYPAGSYEYFATCRGGCTTAAMSIPIAITNQVSSNLPAGAETKVFNSGTAVPVTCTVSTTQLNCIDFVISL